MNDAVNTFLSTLIPNNLPKKKKKLLYSELEGHLYDKADFYKEIGYSEDESIKKAIDDMGTDEEINDGIVSEFEELYHERTWWAVIPAFIILLMNAICFLTGNAVVFIESWGDPSPLNAFISFMMIFVSIGLTALGRIKKYRKWLVGAGLGNMILGIACIYPQSAMFAWTYTAYYLIDKLTPFVVEPLMEWDFLTWGLLYYAFVFFSAIYCFIASVRIKKGKAKDIENAKTKFAVFSACFMAVAVVSCCLLPKAIDFEYEYPHWFNDYQIGMSDDSQELYYNIELGMPYSEAADFLKSEGWISTEEYEKQLDKSDLKKFRYELKSLNFEGDYDVWFNSEKKIKGNGFVFLKQDGNGNVSSKGIGDAGPLEVAQYGYRFFSGYNYDRNDNMNAVIADFEKLKKGDSVETVINNFGVKNGEIYTVFESIENGKKKDYCRVYAHGYENPDPMVAYAYGGSDTRYIEFEFIDGKLTSGEMHWQDWDPDTDVLHKSIKDS